MTDEQQTTPATDVPRPIPIELWGKHHYSMLVYIETRCIDYAGLLDRTHLRMDGGRYPTKLSDGRSVPDHNDRDCADDIVDAGLAYRDGGLYRLTDQGYAVVMGVRRHMARNDRSVIGFDPSLTGADRIAARRAKHEAKGWGAGHDDDEHAGGDLAVVAAIITASVFDDDGTDPERRSYGRVLRAYETYFAREWAVVLVEDHSDPIDRLEIAGSLIAAEIDRRLRAAKGSSDAPTAGEVK